MTASLIMIHRLQRRAITNFFISPIVLPLLHLKALRYLFHCEPPPSLASESYLMVFAPFL